jgi:hypothetical protein
MNRSQLPNTIMKYQPTEKRNPGHPLKRLLDLYWDQSEPQGLSPWEHNDDECYPLNYITSRKWSCLPLRFTDHNFVILHAVFISPHAPPMSRLFSASQFDWLAVMARELYLRGKQFEFRLRHRLISLLIFRGFPLSCQAVDGALSSSLLSGTILTELPQLPVLDIYKSKLQSYNNFLLQTTNTKFPKNPLGIWDLRL